MNSLLACSLVTRIKDVLKSKPCHPDRAQAAQGVIASRFHALCRGFLMTTTMIRMMMMMMTMMMMTMTMMMMMMMMMMFLRPTHCPGLG
jgi:hypothetical protein